MIVRGLPPRRALPVDRAEASALVVVAQGHVLFPTPLTPSSGVQMRCYTSVATAAQQRRSSATSSMRAGCSSRRPEACPSPTWEHTAAAECRASYPLAGYSSCGPVRPQGTAATAAAAAVPRSSSPHPLCDASIRLPSDTVHPEHVHKYPYFVSYWRAMLK